MLTLLREAAFEPRRRFVSLQGDTTIFVGRAAWVRQLRGWLLRGGRAVILDATANPAEYKALGLSGRNPDRRINLRHTDIHVQDAVGIERVFVRWGSGAKGRHVRDGEPAAKELRGVLREIAKLVEQHGGPLGVVAHKPVALALRREVELVARDALFESQLLPQEFAAVVRRGLELRIGWYGHQRGLNMWNGVAVHTTLGDPNPHVGVITAEATALGWDPYGRAMRLREAERNQASGRARPIWGSPKAIVHVGNQKPVLRWAPQWKNATTITLTAGRPETPLPGGMTIEQHERRRLGHEMSKRGYAQSIGMPVATYIRRTTARAAAASADKKVPLSDADPKRIGVTVAMSQTPKIKCRRRTPKNEPFKALVDALRSAIPRAKKPLAHRAAVAALAKMDTREAAHAARAIVGHVGRDAAEAIAHALDHRWSLRRDRLHAAAGVNDPLLAPFSSRLPDLIDRRRREHYDYVWTVMESLPVE